MEQKPTLVNLLMLYLEEHLLPNYKISYEQVFASDVIIADIMINGQWIGTVYNNFFIVWTDYSLKNKILSSDPKFFEKCLKSIKMCIKADIRWKKE